MFVAVLIRLLLGLTFFNGGTASLTEDCITTQNQQMQPEHTLLLEVPNNPLSDIPMTWTRQHTSSSEAGANCAPYLTIRIDDLLDVNWL